MFNRNKVYHEGIKGRVLDVIAFINTYMKEIEQLNGSPTFTRVKERVVWESPEEDII